MEKYFSYMKYLIGLGTNMQDRLSNLSCAIEQLKFLSGMQISSVYETKALLLPNSPPDWNKNYLNIVVSGDSSSSPLEILHICKDIEKNMGRDFQAPRWSPRLIDIDILMAEDEVITTDILTVPHAEMLYRAFVLVPACEISPTSIHPKTYKTLKQHLDGLPKIEISEVIKTEFRL